MPAMTDNTLLVYVNTERVEGESLMLEVETVQGEGDDITLDAFTVEDAEPLDVWGPIFSRVFDHLGITLSDPGDFSWSRTELDSECYEVTINCPFTQNA